MMGKSNATFLTFRGSTGKWYAEARGYLPPDLYRPALQSESVRRAVIVYANDGRMPGLSTAGEEFYVSILPDKDIEFGWPLFLMPNVEPAPVATNGNHMPEPWRPMRDALQPLARLANEYDRRVYPPDEGGQCISVPLCLLRRAADALAKAAADIERLKAAGLPNSDGELFTPAPEATPAMRDAAPDLYAAAKDAWRVMDHVASKIAPSLFICLADDLRFYKTGLEEAFAKAEGRAS